MTDLRPWGVRLVVTAFCAGVIGVGAFCTFGLATACWVAAFVVVAILPYTLAVGWR